MHKAVTPFLQAIRSGHICLHPTDTSPGLTFNPTSQKAHQALSHLKKRSPSKYYLGLVASIEEAKRYWQPLPAQWERILPKLWPNPLTLIWQASSTAPKTLLSPDACLALRYPKLPATSLWLFDVIQHLSCPLPSSSVNISQEQALSSWESAVTFCQQREIFVPSLESEPTFSSAPSTLIKIKKNGTYDILRQGAYPTKTLDSLLN